MTPQEALNLLNNVEFAEKYQGKDEYTDMLLMCKSALEKQIPKKPYKDQYDFWCCPCCNESEYAIMYDSNIADAYNYCHNCGQALDWSE